MQQHKMCIDCVEISGLHIRSSACCTTVEVVDADQQQVEGQWTFSGEMIVLLRALRGDGMTAETERALIADK